MALRKSYWRTEQLPYQAKLIRHWKLLIAQSAMLGLIINRVLPYKRCALSNAFCLRQARKSDFVRLLAAEGV